MAKPRRKDTKKTTSKKAPKAKKPTISEAEFSRRYGMDYDDATGDNSDSK